MPHYRLPTSAPTLIRLLLGALLATCAMAQAPSGSAPPTGKAPLLLQRIDDTLYGVDLLSLAIVDRQHVSGILVRVHAERPHPAKNYSHFVVDCEGQMRLAVLATAVSPLDLTTTGASVRARLLAAAQFLVTANGANAQAGASSDRKSALKPVATLDGSRALAEFTCAAMLRPAQAAPLAQDVYSNGGPRDTRTALCDLRPDGALVTREDVSVRFSDSEKVVAVNQQWLTSGKVTDTEISFGSGSARWVIDRTSAEAQLIDSAGKLIFAGSCVAAEQR